MSRGEILIVAGVVTIPVAVLVAAVIGASFTKSADPQLSNIHRRRRGRARIGARADNQWNPDYAPESLTVKHASA